MKNCTRQEKVLQSINNIQSTLDKIVNLMDNNKSSLVQVESDPQIVGAMGDIEEIAEIILKSIS